MKNFKLYIMILIVMSLILLSCSNEKITEPKGDVFIPPNYDLYEYVLSFEYWEFHEFEGYNWGWFLNIDYNPIDDSEPLAFLYINNREIKVYTSWNEIQKRYILTANPGNFKFQEGDIVSIELTTPRGISDIELRIPLKPVVILPYYIDPTKSLTINWNLSKNADYQTLSAVHWTDFTYFVGLNNYVRSYTIPAFTLPEEFHGSYFEINNFYYRIDGNHAFYIMTRAEQEFREFK